MECGGDNEVLKTYCFWVGKVFCYSGSFFFLFFFSPLPDFIFCKMKVGLEMPCFVVTMITKQERRTNLPNCLSASLQPEVPRQSKFQRHLLWDHKSQQKACHWHQWKQNLATCPMCASESDEPLHISVLQTSEWYFPLPVYSCRSPVTSWHDTTDYPTLHFFNVMFDLKP